MSSHPINVVILNEVKDPRILSLLVLNVAHAE